MYMREIKFLGTEFIITKFRGEEWTKTVSITCSVVVSGKEEVPGLSFMTHLKTTFMKSTANKLACTLAHELKKLVS